MSNTKEPKTDDKTVVKSINEPATTVVDTSTPHSINEPPGSTVGLAPKQDQHSAEPKPAKPAEPAEPETKKHR